VRRPVPAAHIVAIGDILPAAQIVRASGAFFAAQHPLKTALVDRQAEAALQLRQQIARPPFGPFVSTPLNVGHDLRGQAQYPTRRNRTGTVARTLTEPRRRARYLDHTYEIIENNLRFDWNIDRPVIKTCRCNIAPGRK
jgi:hypothetical protein